MNFALPNKSARAFRVAVYARYSTDEQRPESIEDQIETCRRFCERQGWRVVATYSDAAITGSTAHRPEYQRLLADVERDVFDVIVVEALDRLSRRLSDVALLYDCLSFRNAKLFAVDRGEITSLMIGVLGAMAQSFLDDLKHKTKRGLRGKVIAGKSAGSLAYGYQVKPDSPGDRLIVPAEAEVVRRIFTDYADGASPRAIAGRLNAERIPGPHGRPWIDTTIRGQVDRGTGVLNNSAYRGEIVWNRCSYVRHPTTGKRVARMNPENEWEKATDETLRIVDAALWDRVKARQTKVRTEMGRDENGVALNRAHRAKHLLSGLIVCGECGSPFAMRDAKHYGCSNVRSKGTCTQSQRVKRADLERIVGDTIRREWMNEAALARMRADAIAHWRQMYSTSDGQRAKLKAALKRTEAQSARIVNAIVDAGHNPALLAKLKQLEVEQKRLETEIEAIADAVAPDLAEIASDVEATIQSVRDQIESLLSHPVGPNGAKLRELVRGMIERIAIVRHASGAIEATVRGRFAGIMQAAGMAEQYALRTQKAPAPEAAGALGGLVAGAGFEPAAFRL